MQVSWALDGNRGTLVLAANLSNAPVAGFPPTPLQALWQEGESDDNGCFGPWMVRWTIEQAPYRNVLDGNEGSV